MTIRRATVVGMAAVVAACAKVEMIPSPFAGCDTVPPGVFEQVDWNAARKIVVHIRHGEFDPTLIRLMQGRPYVMRVENRDRQSRRLQSADFFEAVYVHSVVAGPDGPQSTSCPSGIRVSPGEAAEVRFIAARDGRYEYSDTMIPYAFGGIAGGIVRIEPMPMLAALASPIVPGITAPEDVPTGPYTPTAAPVVPPQPEAPPAPAEPAAMPMIPPQPEAPAAPAEPAAMPMIPPELEPPPSPAEPAALPMIPPAPETPEPPASPAGLPWLPSAPPEPPAGGPEPTGLPWMPSETPPLPAEPAALPKIPDEPPPPAAAPMSPVESAPPPPAKPATKPEAKIAPEPSPEKAPEAAPQPSPPKSPSPEPAPVAPEARPSSPPGKKDGVGLFGL